jgi:hypothetical protein
MVPGAVMAPQGWLDIHGHFSPPQTIEESQRSFKAMRAACFLTPEPYIWDVDAVLYCLDSAGIAMQMLSNIPPVVSSLKASNDYGNLLVRKHPQRFGLIAALPTDDAEACLSEIHRLTTELSPLADGFAVSTIYNGI